MPAALLLVGAAAAQPSQKLHLTPPGEAAPPAGKGAAAPPPATPPQAAAPALPPLPPPLAQEPPALARLRGLLGPEVQFGVREATQQGEVLTLAGAELRRERSRITIEQLTLEALSETGLLRGEARGIAAETPEGPFRIAEFDLAGLALLPLRPGQPAAERTPDQVTLERLRLAGLDVGGETPFAVGLVALEGWRAGSPGAVRLEGLDVRLPAGQPADRVQVAQASLEGLDLAALLGSLMRDETPELPSTGRQAKRLEGLVVSREGRPLGGIGRLVIENESGPDSSQRARLQLHDAAIEAVPELAEVFTALRLPRLSLELVVEASFAPAARRLAVPALAFGVRELGALGLAAVIEGVEPGTVPSAEAIRLVEGRLRYADQSLYARAVADQARRERIPEARVRQQHAQMIGAALTDARADPALDALRNTLLRFVRGEVREVEIALRPREPLLLGAVPQALAAGPAELVRLLGLSVSAR